MTSRSSHHNLGTVADQCLGRPDPVLIEDDGLKATPVTGTQLQSAIASLQQQLDRQALAPGSAVALFLPLGVAHVAALLAALRVGLTVVPVNLGLRNAALDFVLADADVCLALTDDEHDPLIPGRLDRVRVSVDLDVRGSVETAASAAPVMTDDTAIVMYTSGSTGPPKGVPISHGGYRWAFDQFAGLKDAVAGRTGLVAAPLFHMNGQFHLLNLLSCDATVVLLRPFSGAALLDTLERHNVFRATGVPTMYALAARAAAEAGRSPSRGVGMLALGSAPLSLALHSQLQVQFPEATITNGYGTTETGPVSFGPHPDGLATPPTALGYPMSGVETRLVGGPSEREGTLWIRNRMTLKSYLNRPEATAKSVRDGWYVTGDVLEQDAAGFFYFKGRDDDMMQVGGENLYPREVEALLESHPAVAAAAVVPIADPLKAEKPVAFVVLHPGQEATEADLKAHCLAGGPAFAHPRAVYRLDALPLAGTNKVDRSLLTRWAAERQSEAVKT